MIPSFQMNQYVKNNSEQRHGLKIAEMTRGRNGNKEREMIVISVVELRDNLFDYIDKIIQEETILIQHNQKKNRSVGSFA